MSSMTTCKDPTCTPCKDDEYQQYYTKEVKCNRHPYCDPSKFGKKMAKFSILLMNVQSQTKI